MRKCVIFLCFVAIMLLTTGSFGAGYIWDNKVPNDDSWGNAYNWDANSLPTVDHFAVVRTDFPTVGSGGATVYGTRQAKDIHVGHDGWAGDLTIAPGGSLTGKYLNVPSNEVTQGVATVSVVDVYGQLHMHTGDSSIGGNGPALFNVHSGGEATFVGHTGIGLYPNTVVNIDGLFDSAGTTEFFPGDAPVVNIRGGEFRTYTIRIMPDDDDDDEYEFDLSEEAALAHVDSLVAADKIVSYDGVGVVGAHWVGMYYDYDLRKVVTVNRVIIDSVNAPHQASINNCGDRVKTGDVELSWLNIADPNDNDVVEGDSAGLTYTLYVGLKSGDLSEVEGHTAVPVAYGSPSSYTIATGAAPDEIFWRVDWREDMGGQLGRAFNYGEYSFTTSLDLYPNDLAMSSDLVTWVGYATPVSISYDDDGVSAVTHTWTADDPVVTFDAATSSTASTFATASALPEENPVTITVTVKDGPNPAESKTLELWIYADACQAAAEGLELYNDHDIDNNCEINSVDFASFVEAWLDDYSLTAPILE